MNNIKLSLRLGILVGLIGLLSTGCGKNKLQSTQELDEDSSVSGAAAVSIGGALNDSTSSNSFAVSAKPSNIWQAMVPAAVASNACPTLLNPGSGCSQLTSSVEMNYGACSFGGSPATWTGTLAISVSDGSAVTCGAFPAPVNASIERQFVDSSHSPSIGVRTSRRGTRVIVDHTTQNLGNYQGDVIASTVGSGYGTEVHFNAQGKRDQVNVNQRVYATGIFDHSVTGSLNVAETSSGATRSWTISSGSVTTYHNYAKVKGLTSFTQVTYTSQCCYPVSGTISTTLTATSASGSLGQALNGKTESLTFNGCGSATFVNSNGVSADVQLAHCY